MQRLIAGLIALLGMCVENHAQNLIANPSFEHYFDCPKNRAYKQTGPFLPDWGVHETPDFFHRCSPDKSGVPTNFAGQLMPAGGDAYIGIIVNYGNAKYVEYVEQKLAEPLKKDQLYCCTYYCARASNARIATTPPRISFGPHALGNGTVSALSLQPNVPKKVEKQLAEAVVAFPLQDQIIKATDQWTWICQVYRATGHENYIRIGGQTIKNRPYKRLTYDNPSSVNGNAYYLIDDLAVVPVDAMADCNCRAERSLKIPLPEQPVPVDTAAPALPPTENVIVMKEVVFETNKADLLPASFSEIEKLLALLTANPDMHVQIDGHTDNTGNEEDNITLSNSRAKAVADYLVDQGIHRERVHWKGYGSSVPIADNATEAGRQTNRRVAFKLVHP